MSEERDWIISAREIGISLDKKAISLFERYAQMLEKTNQSLNLTRVPPEDYGTRHFLDSLLLLQFYSFDRQNRSVLDVGTGAGFPGLPLAIVTPQSQFTLMDATRKRLIFLDYVIAELGLQNVKTFHSRAEDAAQLKAHRQQYDLVTSRAVAPLERLIGWTLPFVRAGGVAVAYKGQLTDEEIAQAESILKSEKGSLLRVEETTLPATDAIRKFMFFGKS